jgi:Ala-tRNA(Pro) deacylase
MKKTILTTLDELGIEHREERHRAVFTVAESKKVLTEKTPVKSLLLREKRGEEFILVVIGGDKRLDTNQVSEVMGVKKMMFARPEELKDTLGVTPGSVSLFSLLNDKSKTVRVLIDKQLLSEREIGFHPNDNKSTIFIPGDSIKPFVEKTGHDYQVEEL